MDERRIRLVSDSGEDYPAWAVGSCAVFKIPEEKAIDGRIWLTYNLREKWLAETAMREEAFRIAREGVPKEDTK